MLIKSIKYMQFYILLINKCLSTYVRYKFFSDFHFKILFRIIIHVSDHHPSVELLPMIFFWGLLELLLDFQTNIYLVF